MVRVHPAQAPQLDERNRASARLPCRDAVRGGVATIVDAVRALRAVRLENADGPALPRFPDVPPRS